MLNTEIIRHLAYKNIKDLGDKFEPIVEVYALRFMADILDSSIEWTKKTGDTEEVEPTTRKKRVFNTDYGFINCKACHKKFKRNSLLQFRCNRKDNPKCSSRVKKIQAEAQRYVSTGEIEKANELLRKIGAKEKSVENPVKKTEPEKTFVCRICNETRKSGNGKQIRCTALQSITCTQKYYGIRNEIARLMKKGEHQKAKEIQDIYGIQTNS